MKNFMKFKIIFCGNIWIWFFDFYIEYKEMEFDFWKVNVKYLIYVVIF